MLNFLYKLTYTQLFFLLFTFFLIILIVFSLFIYNINKKFNIINEFYANATVIITIIYSVIAGLLTINVYNQYLQANNIIHNECQDVLNLYEYSKIYNERIKNIIQTELYNYTDNFYKTEINDMKLGIIPIIGKKNLLTIENILINYHPNNLKQNLALNYGLQQLNELKIKREHRILISQNGLNVLLIYVILFLSIILIISHSIFFKQNPIFHFFIGALFIISVTIILSIIIYIDRPFYGNFSISNKPILSLLNKIK
jgi:hypothetical protein